MYDYSFKLNVFKNFYLKSYEIQLKSKLLCIKKKYSQAFNWKITTIVL